MKKKNGNAVDLRHNKFFMNGNMNEEIMKY